MSNSRTSWVGVAVLAALVIVAGVVLALWVSTVAGPGAAPPLTADSTVRVTLLQFNDVYELSPSGGKNEGGLARVATLRKQLLEENPNTLTILSGDLFSPSALGLATVEGEPLAGKQMVDVMNRLGLDYATFGNHEFDVNETQFAQRLAESQFQWVSSNAFMANGQPFTNVLAHVVLTATNATGQAARIGLFGLTLNSNQRNYITYTNWVDAARQQVDVLQNQEQVDVIIAITHLSLDEDKQLAENFPEVNLILGGHEHENWRALRGPNFTPILKADANARTVYVHRLTYDPGTHTLQIESELRRITDQLPDDPDVYRAIQDWEAKGFAAFQQAGFDPEQPLVTLTDELDGLEASVRNQPTNLTDLIAASMLTAAPQAEVAVFNGGSIRIDDRLPPGVLKQYDVLRILPFGGQLVLVNMKGSLLQAVLDAGVANRGAGGYLQTANVVAGQGGWQIQGQPLDLTHDYRVVVNDFLLTGRERRLDFLTRDNPDLTVVQDNIVDIRTALIEQLKKSYPAP